MYNDGVTKIFLYTKGKKGGSKELKELLAFMENTTKANAVDEELQEIQKIVDKIKSQTKAHLISHFQLTEDKADEYLNLYW